MQAKRPGEGSPEPDELAPKLLAWALELGGIDESEAYVSKNVMDIARLETLRHGGRQVGPCVQQLATFTGMEACVRVVVKGAVGTAATTSLDTASLRETVRQARAAARLMTPDPNFRSLARPSRRGARGPAPDARILRGEAPEVLLGQARESACCLPAGIDLAGSIIAVSEVFSVCNSQGVAVERGEDTYAVAQLTAERVEGGEVLSSGMGWSASRALKGLDSLAATRQALELAMLKPKLKSVPPGEYGVLLGPYTVADLIDNMLAPQLGMGAIYTGTSWLPAQRKRDQSGLVLRRPGLGETVAHEDLTLREEPLLPGAMSSRSHDDEGVPTCPRALIEKGVWTGVISNSYYAHLYCMEPPGNGFRRGARPGRMASAPIGCMPTNLVVEPGDMSLEELVEECMGESLYIPRTWYTYPTRYGAPGFSSSNRSTAFLITKGEMVPIAPNAFKLLGDVSTVLKEIRGIGKQAQTATTWAANFCSIVPPILSGGIRVERPEE